MFIAPSLLVYLNLKTWSIGPNRKISYKTNNLLLIASQSQKRAFNPVSEND
jgi:hypothetical protein